MINKKGFFPVAVFVAFFKKFLGLILMGAGGWFIFSQLRESFNLSASGNIFLGIVLFALGVLFTLTIFNKNEKWVYKVWR